MAGLGAESVTPIRPDLATNLQPLQLGVQQNAVALVADSFRQGQITANDIIERYGALAKTKEKAQIQGLEEFISPQAIESRKNQTAFLSEKAKSDLALLPVEQQAKEAVAIETKIKADQGDNASIRKVAIDAGLGGKLSPYASINPEQDAQVYRMAARFAATTKAAKAIGTDVDRRQSIVENAGVNEKGNTFSSTVKDPNKDILASRTSAVVYTQDQAVRAKVLGDMTAEEFIDAGSPSVAQYVFGIDPTVTARPGTAAAPSVAPVKDLVTPRRIIKSETTNPDGSVTKTEEIIESTSHPTPPAPTEPAVEARSPFETSYSEKPAAPVTPKDTELIAKAKQALTLADSAETGYAELESKGYDLAHWSTVGWEVAKEIPGVNKLAELIKPEDRLKFDQSIRSFNEGFLRLVSGAAISVGEHGTYRAMFWPMPGDTADIIADKKRLRADVAVSTAQMVEVGGKFAPGTQGQATVQSVYDRGLKIEARYSKDKAASAQGAGVTTILKSGEEIIDRGGGGIMVRKPTGGTPSTNAPMVVPKYNTPGLKRVIGG